MPGLFAGRHVLEIACGTGYWTQFIAPVAASVAAIDTAAETIRIAEGRVPAGKVRLVAADAYQLPAELGRFDAAFAGFWFSHVPTTRRREFLAELAARLSPGARVVLLDNLYVEGSSTPISERDTGGNTYQTRKLDDGSTHRVLKNFPCEAELNAMVAALGTHPRFTALEYYWVFEYETASADPRVV